MKAVLDDLDPAINAEIQRFSGPKPLLRSRARVLAVKAVRSYDPAGGAKLRSWVVTQLQPLSRYNNALKPVYAPEDAARKSYAVAKAFDAFVDEHGRDPTDEELADAVGISVARLRKVRRMTPAVVNEPHAAGEGDDAPEYAVYAANPVRAAADAVYGGLDARDRRIFDLRTGSHGQSPLQGQDIAALLRVSPAFVTQRANAIASRIVDAAGRAG
jgi:DNA-directed RNA polymerase specialized sigma subunit